MQLMKFLIRWTSGDKVLQSETFILLTIYGDVVADVILFGVLFFKLGVKKCRSFIIWIFN